VIRDAVLHLLNDQPLLIDLFEAPSPSDSVLIGTNLRTLNRTRPLFADSSNATFVFPYAHIRFVELPLGPAAAGPDRGLAPGTAAPEAEGEAGLDLDEDFLRRFRDL
jgi:hypothetical protein